MRLILSILFLINVLVLYGLEPKVDLVREHSFTAIPTPIVTTKASIKSKATGILSKIKTINSLASHFSDARQQVFHKERFFIKSRFSGRTRPLLKATNMKLSYRYVVVPVQFNKTISKKRASFLNSSPFVSVLLNRKSIYSNASAFHSKIESGHVESLRDLGVSIGAGVRVPITSRFHLDLGVRDELGLLNLDGFIMGKNSFSQNNSLGVTLGLKYTI